MCPVAQIVTGWLEAMVPDRDFSHRMGRSARILQGTVPRQAAAGSRFAALNAAKTCKILLYWYRKMSYPFDFQVVSALVTVGQVPV